MAYISLFQEGSHVCHPGNQGISEVEGEEREEKGEIWFASVLSSLKED